MTFISGQGANGSGNLESAQLVDESVAILTNSNANPSIRNIDGQPTQIVLGSYGLTVSTAGMLESPANSQAPTRQVNAVIAPGGYLSTWAAANNAEASLQMLYRSAYTLQLPHGTAAQHEGGDAELALYLDGRQSAVTGLSMVPSIWEINFALIYVLNPALAAEMPAHWAPIPRQVVKALEQSTSGQIPFSAVFVVLALRSRLLSLAALKRSVSMPPSLRARRRIALDSTPRVKDRSKRPARPNQRGSHGARRKHALQERVDLVGDSGTPSKSSES